MNPIATSPQYLEKLLDITWEELAGIVDNIDKYYYKDAKQKTYKDGTPKRKGGTGKIKWRVLYPSIGRLKMIQGRIHKRIFKKLDFPLYIMGGVKKRDSVLNARPHMGKKCKFLTDMSGYYPSVKHSWVYEGLVAFGFSPDIASMLTKLTTYKGYIPQGAPTSTDVANIAFIHLAGKKLARLADENSLTMTLYVDDLTMSSQFDFQDLVPDIINIITSSGLRISHRKTVYTTAKTVDITGVSVGNNQLNAPKHFIETKLNHPENFTEDQIRGHQNRFDRIRKISKSKK